MVKSVDDEHCQPDLLRGKSGGDENKNSDAESEEDEQTPAGEGDGFGLKVCVELMK